MPKPLAPALPASFCALLVLALGAGATTAPSASRTAGSRPLPRPLASILIKNGTVIDGTGSRRRRADVRVASGSIREVGLLRPRAGERVIEARGMIVAPGFIDAHSHADGGLLEAPEAELPIRQGITTAVIGQDGFSQLPLSKYFAQVRARPVALNLASFVGHGSIRRAVMGEGYKRAATPAEVHRMRALAEQEMRAGALGLSSGLEYDPGLYATVGEVIACARVAAAHKGLYISHVRDEENEAFTSFRELVRIAEAARLPAQISHIKLGSSRVWGQSGRALQLIRDARKRGLDITADVYPYTYWRSTITVITPTRDWSDRAAWQKGLDEIGGPGSVLLSTYTPDPAWQGKTLAQISSSTGRDAVSIIQEIVSKTHGEGATGREGVVVTAMREGDLRRFIAAPEVMFCTDGGLRGSHPRAAGSYPRVLGRYVRELRLLTLEEAIRKMTSLPARRMGLENRGQIRPGMKADLVVFDPARVRDTATVADPMSKPIGISHVLVNGVPVLDGGTITGRRPGVILRRSS